MRLYEHRTQQHNYILLIYIKSAKNTFDYYLDKFYKKNCIIVKFTNKSRIISYEELLEQKYSGYGFYYGDKETLEYNIKIQNCLQYSYLNKIINI